MSKLTTRRKVASQEGTFTRSKEGKPVSTSTLETPTPAPTITQAEITARAYAFFLARGGTHGDDQADWYRAEAELRREKGLEEAKASRNF